jgi:hypothetical protein
MKHSAFRNPQSAVAILLLLAAPGCLTPPGIDTGKQPDLRPDQWQKPATYQPLPPDPTPPPPSDMVTGKWYTLTGPFVPVTNAPTRRP